MSKYFLLFLLFPILCFGQTIVSGDVSGFWSRDNSPYIIAGDVNIPNGEELWIDAGVTVRWKPSVVVANMTVRGVLTVAGEPGDTVIFTSNALRPRDTDWGTIVMMGGLAKITCAKFDYYKPAIGISTGTLLEVKNSRFVRYDLTRQGNPDPDTTAYAVGGFMTDTLTFINCEIDGKSKTTDGIHVETSAKGHFTADSCRIHHLTSDGIYTYYKGNDADPATRSVLIQNSCFTNGGNGLWVYAVRCKIKILNNDIFDHTGTGLYVGMDAKFPDVLNIVNQRIHHCATGLKLEGGNNPDPHLNIYCQFCTIAHCSEAIRVNTSGYIRYANNISAYNTGSGTFSAGDGVRIFDMYWDDTNNKRVHDGAIYADPLLVGEYDMHLAWNSPAIDKAGVEFPVDDEPEPNGGRANIGAYGQTTEATTSPEQRLGGKLYCSRPTIGMAITATGSTMDYKWVRFGNFGDSSLTILSYTLSDTVNFALSALPLLELAPMQETPDKKPVITFQPTVSKAFSESLTVHTTGNDLVIPITAFSTDHPIISGEYRDSVVFTKDQSPYYIKGPANIPRLTIEPGVTVLFYDSTSHLSLGTFNAVGTREEPICFQPLDNGALPRKVLTGVGFYAGNLVFVKVDGLQGLSCQIRSDNSLLKMRDVMINGDDDPQSYGISVSVTGKNCQVDVERVTIVGCTTGLGCSIDDSTAEVNVRQITSVNNQKGVSFDIYEPNGRIFLPPDFLENSIIAHNGIGIYGLTKLFKDSTVIHDVLLWDNKTESDFTASGENYQGPINLENILRVDPLLIRTHSHPFVLDSRSPCIDAGNPDSPADPDGSQADLGAWWYDHNNQPPIIARVEPEEVDVEADSGDVVTFAMLGDDEEGDKLDYLWQIGDSTFWSGDVCKWKFTNTGDVVVGAQAFDGYNYSATVDWRVYIAPLDVRQTEMPHEFTITSVYPNPFNDLATIRYTIPSPGTVELAIYDIQGRLLLRNSHIRIAAGELQQVLDFSRLPTGLFFVRMQYGGKVETRKVVHLR